MDRFSPQRVLVSIPWTDICCDLCHSTEHVAWKEVEDHHLHTVGRHTLLRCKQCGLIWLYSLRREHAREQGKAGSDDLGYGRSDYAPHHPGATLRSPRAFPANLKRAMLARRRGYASQATASLLASSLEWLVAPLVVRRLERIPNCVPGGRLLDIGCGNGRYVAAMAALGWQAVGVEPEVGVSRLARHLSDAGVIVGGHAEDLPFGARAFDVVTLWHVLEHLLSPARALAEVQRVLRPGGVLLLETPNVESSQSRLFGRYWFHLDPPRHRFLLSPATIRAYLSINGFQDIQVKTIPSSVGIVGTLQTMIHLVTQRKGPNLLKSRLLRWPWEPIEQLETLRGRGGCMWASARVP
jgi:2-polyprenyl-3-methyl-5-hydroxy-6-metoxy-1,4-benzoquinol methylase